MKMNFLNWMMGLFVMTVLAGCSNWSTGRYSISADNVVTLRSLKGTTLNVGTFTSNEENQGKINCRGDGDVITPDGETFSNFIRKALIDELKIAGAYSSLAPIIITGHLDKIDFSTIDGYWEIALQVKLSTGKSMSITEQYAYTPGSDWAGHGAPCIQTAIAFVPAVQNLIGKVVSSPEFSSLVTGL